MTGFSFFMALEYS